MAKVGIILTQFTLQDILRAYQVSEQLEKCKAESFSIQLFATQLVEDGTDKKLLHEWTHREGDEVADRPTVYLNEIVSYTWAVENYVTLDIAPANFPSDEILPKIYEGFKKMASLLQKTEMSNVNTIQMTSWLLNTKFELKIRQIFSKILSEDLHFSDNSSYAPPTRCSS